MVMIPSVPPYSSTTMARWTCFLRNSWRSWEIFLRFWSIQHVLDDGLDWGAQYFGIVALFKLHEFGEDVFLHEDADDVVEALSVDGDAAVALFVKQLGGLFDAHVGWQAEDIDSRHHDLACDPIAEQHHGLDELLVMGIEAGVDVGLLDHLKELLLGLCG